METYYEYLNWCKGYNERNLIDPSSDKMEWHHTLPQCIFGDIRIGLWLTLKQHAIATALQTLAFNKNCLCPWHKQHLPELVWELCRPIFVRHKVELGHKSVKSGHVAHMQSCIDRKVQREAAQRVGQQHVESGHLARIRSLRDMGKLVDNAQTMGKKYGQRAKESGQWDAIKPLGAAAQHAQRWINLAPGYPQHESTPCGLSKWQKVRGIDHTDKSLRRRIS